MEEKVRNERCVAIVTLIDKHNMSKTELLMLRWSDS